VEPAVRFRREPKKLISENNHGVFVGGENNSAEKRTVMIFPVVFVRGNQVYRFEIR
jgi:hypothetical protein